MEFELRLFDEPLLRFSADPQTAAVEYAVNWVSPKQQLLPWGMSPTPEGLALWIRHRSIPKNRAFVSTFLARNGLSVNKPLSVIALCKGLSLNDCYWVAQVGDKETFDKVNLYENPINRLLAQVAFTGYGSNVRSGFVSSPEFTTNGMLPKCWRRIDGKIYLYKGGTTGFANTGFEPYSEYYAADVADAMDIAHVDYRLHTWKGLLCSACELFTSKTLSYVPAANVVKSGGFSAVFEHYRSMGPEFEQALSDMLALDAIICNTDRHMNNFGFLARSQTNEIVAPAPLFDHGNSLFHQAYGDDWTSLDALRSYADAQAACLYDDFFSVAKEFMTQETRAKVRSVLGFSFSRGIKKRFPKERHRLTEQLIRERAQKLLAK